MPWRSEASVSAPAPTNFRQGVVPGAAEPERPVKSRTLDLTQAREANRSSRREKPRMASVDFDANPSQGSEKSEKGSWSRTTSTYNTGTSFLKRLMARRSSDSAALPSALPPLDGKRLEGGVSSDSEGEENSSLDSCSSRESSSSRCVSSESRSPLGDSGGWNGGGSSPVRGRANTTGQKSSSAAASCGRTRQPSKSTEAVASPQAEQGPPGIEWMARLQADPDVRDDRRRCCRQILMQLEEASPCSMSDMEAVVRIRLADKLESEVSQCLQSLARQAYNAMKENWEELQASKRGAAEAEEKLARMNGNFLKEISHNRDRLRRGYDVVKDALSEVEASSVEFYEPLHFMSPQVRSTTLAIIEEKLKAIFAYDPTLKERTNAVELSRFEDTMLRDRLASFERLNASLREEVRTVRARLKKAESQQENRHCQFIEVRKELADVKAELKLAREERDKALKAAAAPCSSADCDEELSSATCHWFSEGSAREARTSDAEVQTMPVHRRSTEPVVLMEAPGMGASWGAQDKEALLDDLQKARSDLGLARALLRKREAEVGQLRAAGKEEAQLAPVKDCDSGMAVNNSLITVKDSGTGGTDDKGPDADRLQRELQAARAGEEAARAEAARREEEASTLRDTLERTQEEVTRLQTALQVTSDLRQRLQDELEQAREDLALAERRRKQLLLEQAKEGCSGAVAGELEAEMKASGELREEVEHLKAAMCLLVSRNDALQAALAASGAAAPADAAAPAELAATFAQVRAAEREFREVSLLQDQRHELRERAAQQKAQLQMLVRENQVMQMALDSLQHDVQVLARQLRRYMPDSQVMSSDLESVLGKMDKVARNGGGAYVRLNKEARLREVASEVREAQREQQEDPLLRAAAQPQQGLTVRSSTKTTSTHSRTLQTPVAVCFPGEATAPTTPTSSTSPTVPKPARLGRLATDSSNNSARAGAGEAQRPPSTMRKAGGLLPHAGQEKRSTRYAGARAAIAMTPLGNSWRRTHT